MGRTAGEPDSGDPSGIIPRGRGKKERRAQLGVESALCVCVDIYK